MTRGWLSYAVVVAVMSVDCILIITCIDSWTYFYGCQVDSVFIFVNFCRIVLTKVRNMIHLTSDQYIVSSQLDYVRL